jgi:hypothetical protein
MDRLSYESVVDQMVSALAESRRARLTRDAAYIALARAILEDDTADARELFELKDPLAA